MRFSTVVGIILTMAVGTQANAYCQCLYENGSHCCITENVGGCTKSCMNMTPLFGTAACNAKGKHSNVSAWHAQFRTACA